MNKKRLLFKQNSGAIPLTYVWKSVFEPYFEFDTFSVTDSVDMYDPENDVIWVISPEDALGLVEPWLDAGYKVVLDYLWDHYGVSYSTENAFLLKTNNIILMHESLHYRALGYKESHYNNDPDKLFLCLMHQDRPNRAALYDKVKKYSDTSLISFVSRGIVLQGDVSFEQTGGYTGFPSWQNFANLNWYNSTAFSLVSETSVYDSRFYTEKTLKAFAHKHPLVVWGAANILKRLKKLGFETFGHVIDESYDNIIDNNLRLNKISEVVDSMNKEFQKNRYFLHDAKTKEIIEHNHNLFYNEKFIAKLIDDEIMGPLKRFVYE